MIDKEFSDLTAEVHYLRKVVAELQRHAIAEMAQGLCYDSGEGSDHYTHDNSVADDAAKALDRIAGEDPELQYQIGIKGLKSPWTSTKIWGIEKLGNLRRREAIEPLREIVKEFSNQDAYGKLKEAARSALRKLGVE